MLHIILNRKLHTITSFQMAKNMAVCTVVTLNSTKIGFSHSTSTFKSLSNKLDIKTRFAVSVVGILYENISLTDIPGSLGSKELRLQVAKTCACLLLSRKALHLRGMLETDNLV